MKPFLPQLFRDLRNDKYKREQRKSPIKKQITILWFLGPEISLYASDEQPIDISKRLVTVCPISANLTCKVDLRRELGSRVLDGTAIATSFALLDSSTMYLTKFGSCGVKESLLSQTNSILLSKQASFMEGALFGAFK